MMNPSKKMGVEEQDYDDDVCHAMNCITCICEDSQMYMSSEKETGLPAHNYQNACS